MHINKQNTDVLLKEKYTKQFTNLYITVCLGTIRYVLSFNYLEKWFYIS